MPVMYEDSTHRLWDCETKQGTMILKVCNSDNVAESTFWQGMSSLFAVDLPQQLNEFESVFNMLTKLDTLVIPDFIAAGSMTEDENAFIVVKKVSGTMVTIEDVDDGMVIDLAKHLAKLHSQTNIKWGRLGQTELGSGLWVQRLKITLDSLGKKQSLVVPRQILAEAIELADQCIVEQFVPIMLDLRWDQFLQENGVLSALVDLDAFVYGPRELELVLLEYIFDEQQTLLFSKAYQQYHSMPDLSPVRTAYRLLLFLMNVLGEKSVDAWMQAPTRF
ncbi:MAG: phosphotransferase [Methylophaga sp.]|nr:phosphotransferase [Methylophaga sp.]